jgi:hypothetical protein
VNGEIQLQIFSGSSLINPALEGGTTGFSQKKKYNVPWTISAGYM